MRWICCCPTLILLIIILSFDTAHAQIYVSPAGSDSNAGTFDQPYLTIPKAHSVVSAGDTIYLRGGTYIVSATITLSKNGSDTARYALVAYPGERALLDCSSMAFSSSNRGLRISGKYWYIYGIDIKGAGDNGLNISGSNNIVEFCSFYENRDTGLQLGGGASNNHVINCDAYHNADPTFENADGYAAKLDVGTGNVFTGCRSWENADDGWDGYLRPSDSVFTTLQNCWAFKNGYLKDGTPSLPNGDGNGFKMGGSDLKDLHHNMTLIRCLAFDNRVKGFDENNNRGSMTIINGTSFRNGTNYSLPGPVDPGYTMTITNSIVFGALGTVDAAVVVTTNSWMSPFSVDSSDFQSLDTTGVRGPRGPNGELPSVPFMRLASGSDLIDAGTDAGYPFLGSLPDLGAFETDPSTAVPDPNITPTSFVVHPSYPNPFNPSTVIQYEIPGPGLVTLTIFDVTGRRLTGETRTHDITGSFTFRWNGSSELGASVPSGLYLARISFGTHVHLLKLALIK